MRARITKVGTAEKGPDGRRLVTGWEMEGGPGWSISGVDRSEETFGGWSSDELAAIAGYAAVYGESSALEMANTPDQWFTRWPTDDES